MDDDNQIDDEPKIMGVPNRQLLYSRASKYAPKAIRKLAEQLDSKNESVVLGAAKTLLAKVIPDLKSNELVGKDGQPIAINILRDYLSTSGTHATSISSIEGSDEVQSTHLAQEGSQNIDIAGEVGNRGTQSVP